MNPHHLGLAAIGNNYHICSSILIIAYHHHSTLHLYMMLNKRLYHPHTPVIPGKSTARSRNAVERVPTYEGCGAGYIETQHSCSKRGRMREIL
jgi:hypothetical protein